MRMVLPNWLGSAFRVQFAGDVGDRHSVEPLVPLRGVVACAGAVEAHETNKAIQAELALKNGKRMLLKLFVGEFLNGSHSRPVFRSTPCGPATRYAAPLNLGGEFVVGAGHDVCDDDGVVFRSVAEEEAEVAGAMGA